MHIKIGAVQSGRSGRMDTKFSVAVHALILISESPEPIDSEKMARSVGTNASYIRKILGLLKKAEIYDLTYQKQAGGAVRLSLRRWPRTSSGCAGNRRFPPVLPSPHPGPRHPRIVHRFDLRIEIGRDLQKKCCESVPATDPHRSLLRWDHR